jgi:hypothetical protein
MSGTSYAVLNLEKVPLLNAGKLGTLAVKGGGVVLGFVSVALTAADIKAN